MNPPSQSIANSRASIFKKWLALDWRDHILLIRALGVLAHASLLIAFQPFSSVAKVANSQTCATPIAPEDRALVVSKIRWAILVWARRVPWSAVCFQQALAAHIMLRRRGINSTLYYGATPNGAQGLAAHVWVRDGEVFVIGGEVAANFSVLASFPTDDTPIDGS